MLADDCAVYACEVPTDTAKRVAGFLEHVQMCLEGGVHFEHMRK